MVTLWRIRLSLIDRSSYNRSTLSFLKLTTLKTTCIFYGLKGYKKVIWCLYLQLFFTTLKEIGKKVKAIASKNLRPCLWYNQCFSQFWINRRIRLAFRWKLYVSAPTSGDRGLISLIELKKNIELKTHILFLIKTHERTMGCSVKYEQCMFTQNVTRKIRTNVLGIDSKVNALVGIRKYETLLLQIYVSETSELYC